MDYLLYSQYIISIKWWLMCLLFGVWTNSSSSALTEDNIRKHQSHLTKSIFT